MAVAASTVRDQVAWSCTIPWALLFPMPSGRVCLYCWSMGCSDYMRLLHVFQAAWSVYSRTDRLFTVAITVNCSSIHLRATAVQFVCFMLMCIACLGIMRLLSAGQFSLGYRVSACTWPNLPGISMIHALGYSLGNQWFGLVLCTHTGLTFLDPLFDYRLMCHSFIRIMA